MLSALTQRRLCWALVHSRERRDVRDGVQLVEAMLTDEQGQDQRDLMYLLAVGQFRQRNYMGARQASAAGP